MKNFFKKVVILILFVEAKIVLFIKKPKIIAITGTVGKTTTKDIIYAGLQDSFSVRKSPKGFNSDIGVLLTVLDLKTHGASVSGWAKNIIKGFCLIFKKSYPELLVLEVGANYPGEIQKNAKLLKADIVVFTILPEIMAHMEFFENRRHFIDEKMSLALSMKKDGVILYNGDDKTLTQEMERKIFDNYNKKTFGKNAQFNFENIFIEQKNGVISGMDVVLKDNRVHLKGVLGEHLGYPVCALLAIGSALNVEQSFILESLQKNFVPAPGRMRVFEGIKNSTIIDDSYNALPESVKNGAQTLDQINTKGRKIYVLGRLAELGEYSVESYKKAVEYIRQSCNIIFLVNDGGLAEQFAKEMEFKEVHVFNNYSDDYFANTDEAGSFLKDYVREGDVLIFKGARHSTAFERAISQLIKKEDIKYLVQEHLQ